MLTETGSRQPQVPPSALGNYKYRKVELGMVGYRCLALVKKLMAHTKCPWANGFDARASGLSEDEATERLA